MCKSHAANLLILDLKNPIIDKVKIVSNLIYLLFFIFFDSIEQMIIPKIFF